jgi:hypothetical protein
MKIDLGIDPNRPLVFAFEDDLYAAPARPDGNAPRTYETETFSDESEPSEKPKKPSAAATMRGRRAVERPIQKTPRKNKTPELTDDDTDMDELSARESEDEDEDDRPTYRKPPPDRPKPRLIPAPKRPTSLDEAMDVRLSTLVDTPLKLVWTDLLALGASAGDLIFAPLWRQDLTQPVVGRLRVTWRDLVDAGLTKDMLIEVGRPFRFWNAVFGASELFVQHFELDQDDWEELNWDHADILALTGYRVLLNTHTGLVECVDRCRRQISD